MNEKTKLRIIQILCVISLIVTVFSIQKTYAKYFEKIDTTYATNIKKWVIKVAGTKIHQLGKDELNEVMTPVLVENEHMNTGVLVPGRHGYFPFEIDYKDVDLPFRFNFDINQLNQITLTDENTGTTTTIDNKLEDFEVYGYEIIDGENTYTADIVNLDEINAIIDTDNNLITYTKVIKTTDEGTGEEIITKQTATKELNEDNAVEIRVLFRWNDDNKDTTDGNDEEGMNNYEDTQYAGTAIEGDNVHTNLDYNVKVTFTQHVVTNRS